MNVIAVKSSDLRIKSSGSRMHAAEIGTETKINRSDGLWPGVQLSVGLGQGLTAWQQVLL